MGTNTNELSSAEETGVLIAGAGIGGLTAALALHAEGIRVTVIERVRQITPSEWASASSRTRCAN
ncbi:FAD-dependent monooxygenase [Streptomyces rectiviolaceus]|uniref:FAD-dependent monooxygenase n=1 Tax=Streptomyces rectiviolaceus TaxID=332591 RepID=UPI00363FA230